MRLHNSVARQWVATLDSYANQTYGRPIHSSVADGTCVRCGTPVPPFTSPDARAIYRRHGLCQRCQDAPAATPHDPAGRGSISKKVLKWIR